MKQLEMLYEGKAKQVFRTDDPEKIIIHYKDAATAFNNIKKATIENKGVLNNAISTPSLSPRDMNFVCVVFNLKKEELKCYTRKLLRDRLLNS